MLALSIRQPWASLILHCGKDVENRSWRTHVRGRVLIHAAKVCTRVEFCEAMEFASEIKKTMVILDHRSIPLGGIIGSAVIVDCVEVCASPWFVGRYGFVLRDPKPLPFRPWRGELGFFNVPEEGKPCESTSTARN